MPDGLVIPGGPGFSGHPQPPDVPCDPTGDAWRGEPGPPGPPGPPGQSGNFGGTVIATGSTTPRTMQDRAADWVNVKDFGALLNGTTGVDAAALGAALATLQPQESIFMPGGTASLVWGGVQGTTPTTPVRFLLDGTTSGGNPMVAAFNRPNKGDLFETYYSGTKYFSVESANADAQGPLRVDFYNSGFPLGTGAGVPGTRAFVSTPIRVNAQDYPGAITSIWGVHVSMDTYSTAYAGAGSGWPQHVGGSFSVRKHGNHWLSGAHITAAEMNNQPSSVNIALVGLEIGHRAQADDDGGLPGSPGIRLGIHLSQAEQPPPLDGGVTPTMPAVFGMGYNLDGTANAVTKSCFGVTGVQTYQVFDARTGTVPPGYTNPVAALRMDPGQIIDFNGASTVASSGWKGNAGNYLQYTTTGTPRLRYMAGANEAWAISDAGAWSGSSFGTAIGQVPVFQNYQSTGFASLAFPTRFIVSKSGATTPTDFTTMQVFRTTTHTGGAAGNVATALRVGTTIGNGVTNQEWALLSTVVSNSTTPGGAAVGGDFQAQRNAGSPTPIWGGIFNAIDLSGTSSSATLGAVLAGEIDVRTTGADDGLNGNMVGGMGLRAGLQFVLVRNLTTVDVEASHAIWFSCNEPANAKWSSAIGFANGTQTYQALDTRGAVPPTGYTSPVAAVRMLAGQAVDFNGGPALNSAPGNFLQYTTTGTPRLRYMVGANERWSVSDSGALSASVTATGGTTVRTLQDHFADVVNVRDFGAVFDGASHPLSGYYSTLAAAQAVYPHAVALTDEIDGVAIQAAINLCQSRVSSYSYGGTVMLPHGNGLVNQPLAISKQNVSLQSQGAEFMVGANVSRATPSAPTRLTWTGAPRTAGQFQANMLTIAPTDGGRLLSGCNLRGVLFYCNQIAGTAGPLIASMRHAIIECATHEPAGVPYPSASLTSGSQVIAVSSTAGLRVGESVVSASLPWGAYVASITDATHFNVSAQATATSTETVTIGGEGIRFDVVDGLSDSNDTQFLRVRFKGYAQAGAVNATAPLVMIGGSGVVGSGGGTHWGNTSVCWFDDIQGIINNGHMVVCNNSDHNFHQNLTAQNVGGGPGRLLICNASLDHNNSCARFHLFNHLGDGGIHVGTDTGGFIYAAVGNRILYLDRQNGAPIPTVGVGASVMVGADNQQALSYTGGVQPIIGHMPDNTVAGGNLRAANAVDLQTVRTAATQVVSGLQSVISGGANNTVSGQWAAVGGGSGNSITASYSTIPGGINNTASQSYSVAMGNNAVADLYGTVAFATGIIAAGRRAQYNLQLLKAVSAANITPVRLTADQAAAGAANVVNMTASSQVNAMTVALVATDSTNALNSYVWRQPLGLLKRSGTAATTTYTPGTPVILTSGTTAGIAITEAADTTNGGYSLTFTPPTGNAAIWRVVATVEWTRVDGA